ncbi:hypothetical protein ERD78_00500 [Allopusillimonas soli]|uniref:Uncharacterized protein n=1 Tax=Allopusillimonas soli TaxID=659016 RepID=A0A853F669_9BURK|nr:hypothetical protein [Allopusillimonas soli]NYT35338.1 hypothetical protein [Allopusillimonas soli]TEA75760.1 hypothetical protein ERD78_00500 [Allopusillimonas soli]
MDFDIAKEKITALVAEAISSDSDLDDLRWDVNTIAKSGRVSLSELKSLIISGWVQVVAAHPSDEPISREMELRLLELQNHFSLMRNDLNQSGAYSQVVRLVILRNVMEGQVPEVKLDFPVPFELQDERLVWAMRNVDYYKERSRTERIGASHGVELMAGEGLLLQVDESKGELVSITELVCMGVGTLGVTDKHVYFDTGNERFCIPYKSIVMFESFSDGVVLHRENAEPLGFATSDGGYLSKLLIELSHLQNQ